MFTIYDLPQKKHRFSRFAFWFCIHTAVTELPVEGGIVGELFANILADGFSRLRKGDRLWFEGFGGGLNYGKSTTEDLVIWVKVKYSYQDKHPTFSITS